MLDLSALDLAFRARAFALLVCTTGSTTLSATATGYARASGSFVSDGFKIGMEVVPFGFTQTTPATVIGVAALALTIQGGRTVEASGSGRSLSVTLPPHRVIENTDYTPTPTRQFVEVELVPATQTLRSFPAAGGVTEHTGLYVVRWYGLANTGTAGLRTCIDALCAEFTPGTVLLNGATVARVRGDVSTFVSQISNTLPGFAVCTVKVPWRAHSINAVAA